MARMLLSSLSIFQTGFWTPEGPWVISKGPAKEEQSCGL